jgi:Uma2 family endonuclease
MSTMTTTDELHHVLLELLPPQGGWTEEEYLWLTDDTNRLIEFTDGYIEVLPMPTDEHQGISLFFCMALVQYLQPLGGVVRFSPLRLRLRAGKYREPDLLILRDARDPRRQNPYWHWADLVMEIVSEDKPERDLVEKRADYAEAGIPEYWIVNPLNQTILVLALREGTYVAHGVFRRGTRATSVILADFAVDVDTVLAQT